MKHRGGSRLARAIAATLAIVTVAAACSGGNDNKSDENKTTTTTAKKFTDEVIAPVLAATKKAGSGKVDGFVTDRNDKKRGPLDGEWSGDLSGEGLARLAFVASNGTQVPTEMRWIKSTLYYQRSTIRLPDGDSLAVFTRTAQFKPWRSAPVSGGVAQAIPSAFSPVALLQWIAKTRVGFAKSGTETIGSVKTTRYTTKKPVATVGMWGSATVDVWADGKDRVVRVRITSRSGGTQYDVADYGTKVEVEAPAADQISKISELPKIEPSGPFVPVKSGTTNGVNWALERAPGTVKTTCWRFTATPPLVQQNKVGWRCFRPVDPDAEPDDQVQFLAFGNGLGPYDAIAVIPPTGATKADIGFVGNAATTPLPIDGPPFVWVGQASPTKGYLGFTLADGRVIDCGAGAVTTPDDLLNPTYTQMVSQSGWACLPREP